VKKNIEYNYQFLIGLLLMVLTITGCDEGNGFGTEVLPREDLVSIKNVVIKDDISSFTFNEKLIRTDEASKSLLGSFNESLFGVSTIDFASQFRLQAYPDFGENPVADSIKLVVRYRTLYGDTITPQTFRVFEMESPLDIDGEYYQDVDLKSMASDFLLGEYYYTPRVTQDSAKRDTFQQVFSIPLDISLGDKIINADSSQLINNDVFTEFFKGLYIETATLNDEGGAILSLDAISSSSYLGTGLVLYYNNDENKAAEVPDTLFTPFLISKNSARVNSMLHDYSGTPFVDNLNSEAVEDSLIFVQSTGGLRSRILIDGLSSWEDSLNTAINKAELIFQIDTIASDIHNFPPPSQLLFTVVDEDGNDFLPIDYVFSPTYYGGGLRDDYTYHFNITQHLQQIIEGQAENYGFYLTPANKNNEANRVIIKGARSEVGIRLLITYTKYSI
jgi:hypothetical protein